MNNDELDIFKEYIRQQSKDARGDINYPMMSGYLLGVIADLAMEFPQVSHKLMERVQRDAHKKTA